MMRELCAMQRVSNHTTQGDERQQVCPLPICQCAEGIVLLRLSPAGSEGRKQRQLWLGLRGIIGYSCDYYLFC
jgi:hypothetical protein